MNLRSYLRKFEGLRGRAKSKYFIQRRILMKKNTLIVLAILGLVCLFSQVFADDQQQTTNATPQPQTTPVTQVQQSRTMIVTPGVAVVDGKLDDAAWANAVWNDFNEKTANVENGAWNNYSARFAMMYDKNMLYFAFVAKDAKLLNDFSGADIWQADDVELWFNWKQATMESKPGYYQIGLAPITKNGRPGFGIWRTVPGADVKALKGIVMASKKTNDGWVIEASLDLNDFNGAQPLPQNATFNLSVVNRDIEGSQRDAGWNHYTWNGKNHPNPAKFVPLVFQGAQQ
jgi:hypothetical protein